MEGHPMLVDQQNQYCKNDYTTKSNLHVQCNPHQNSNNILHQEIKVNLKVPMEAHKTLNNQSNPKPMEQTGGITIPDLKFILQTHNNKNRVLAPKQT
jgi:hypothetical protein